MIRHLIAEAITLALLGAAMFVLGSFFLAAHYKGVERLRAAGRDFRDGFRDGVKDARNGRGAR